MMEIPSILNSRLQALTQMGLDGDERFLSLDRLTRLASRLADSPASQVALVGASTVRSVSVFQNGEWRPEVVHRPLEESFCAHVVRRGEAVVVGDARQHPEFSAMRLVREGGAISYVGVPLRNGEGVALGALCAWDQVPRSWGEREVGLLEDLAEGVMAEIQLRAELRERERLERRSEASESRYRYIFENAPYGIFAVDKSGEVLEVNAAVGAITGRPRLEPGEKRRFGESIAPDSLARAREAFAAILVGGEVREFELDLVHVDGGRRTVVCTATPAWDGGEVTGIYGLLRDITEERRQAEIVRRSERLTSLGTLVGGVAHELNNPLSAIKGMSQMLLLEEGGGVEREWLEMMAREADRASQVVADLRRLVWGEEGRDTGPSAAEVNEVIAHILKFGAYTVQDDGVRLETRLEEGLPPVRLPRAQMEQVVLNLVTNARQALLEVPAERRRLEVRSERGQGMVRLTVTDSGPGIPPENQGRVFDPFFTTKAPGEGTGLGLSLVHRMVSEAGGEIRLESVAGQGASFVVELPAAEIAPPSLPSLSSPAEPRQVRRVLVVDDEVPIRTILSRMLRQRGHAVDEAGDGGEAMRLIEESPCSYDVILSDLRMPGVDGFELLRRLRQRNAALIQRLVFITGDVASGEAARLLEEAGVPVLLKPFDLQQVIDRVEGGEANR